VVKKERTPCRAGTPGLAGLADVLARCCSPSPPTLAPASPVTCVRRSGLAVEEPWLGTRPDRGRCDPPDDDEHRRLLDDWFGFPAGQGRARGQPAVIGTGPAPFRARTAVRGWRNTRSPTWRRHLGNWGLPGGGMGAVVQRHRAGRPRARCRGPGERQGGPRPGPRTPGRRRVLENGAKIRAQVIRVHCTPGPRSWTRFGREHLPPDFPGRHRALEDRRGGGEDQPGPGRAARLIADPGSNLQDTTAGRWRWHPRWSTSRRAFQDAREGQGGRPAVQRRR